MADLPEKLRLKGLAEEDIYFAKRDRELIDALHHRGPVERSKAKKAVACGAETPQSPNHPAAGVKESRWFEKLIRLFRCGTGKTA